MSKRVFAFLMMLLSIPFILPFAQEKTTESRMNAGTFAGLRLRNIGPAQKSGRIADIAKDPNDPSVWYVAVASGNVWKTVNNGTTWQPIFDNYGSYSIGCVAIDPNNSNVVWIGTGENNSQRSVGWGDGVYKSLDAGMSWKNVGLPKSEHIGEILIDPRDSNTVYVASQGPLWAPGGDRGLYKTTDGGGTWERILHVSDNTGISDIAFDPRNPEVIYATSYQRRRHVWTLVAGGPEGAIYKSSDAGATWKKIVRGLPGVDLGRIGIAVSPINPDVLYATVPAAWGESGFYRSENGGESWARMSDYITIDPQYYQELFADPHHFDRVYSMDVFIHVTEDGGRNWSRVNSRFKHVDNHALLFDAEDPNYLMIGTDGGIYETWDRTKTWRYVSNLPITQFYRVGIDNSEPFYFVYGGTQDNATLGGPSRTTNAHGIRNSDWFVTVGGDGYQTRVDPTDPNILYSMWQYGGLIRFDRRSGERIDIQPQPGKGDPPVIWNWDSPLVLSPHSPTRLYFGSNILFRSDDRGDTWRSVSPDLTKGIDRNKLEAMGTVWSVETVWKNVWTSFYGNMVALDESPLTEGLLVAGMDDGGIHVTQDSGENWRSIDAIDGVPELTYVADLIASMHDANRIYAVFNNHKRGDFKPYVYRSDDLGNTWKSITGNLPDGHVTWTLEEDHVNENLLFVGTEFGLFFSVDAGENWIQLKGNVPTIPVRDIEIQRRENDVVCATFGRGFIILEDYTPLREMSEEALNSEATLFPVKDALMYIQSGPLGWGEKGSLGDEFFTAPNPPFGAIFTYYLRDSVTTLRQQRKKQELALQKEGKPVFYPEWDSLRTEDRQDDPSIVFEIINSDGTVVRRIFAPARRGFNRVNWDLRYASMGPTRERGDKNSWWTGGSAGLALPGEYTVQMYLLNDGALTALAAPQSFNAKPLGLNTLEATEKSALVAFQSDVKKLQQSILAMREYLNDLFVRVRSVKKALIGHGGDSGAMFTSARSMEEELYEIDQVLNGDESVSSRFEATPPSLMDRINRAAAGFWSTSPPTTTHKNEYRIASELYAELYGRITTLLANKLKPLEEQLDAGGIPWTPGRKLPQPPR